MLLTLRFLATCLFAALLAALLLLLRIPLALSIGTATELFAIHLALLSLLPSSLGIATVVGTRILTLIDIVHTLLHCS
ncbi:hypothetical protein DCO49_05460 [Stenotrophomonas sp. SPM]|nr:hypothetical protein DCO49_05460 [Stenotrophomonas sp. SPM]